MSEYKKYDKQTRPIVDKFHHIMVEHMQLVWETLWQNKADFTTQYPEMAPKIRVDKVPIPDAPEAEAWTPEERQTINSNEPKLREETPEDRPITEDWAQYQNGKRLRAGTNMQPTNQKRKIYITKVDAKSEPKRSVFRRFSTTEALNQFTNKHPETPHAVPAFLNRRAETERLAFHPVHSKHPRATPTFLNLRTETNRKAFRPTSGTSTTIPAFLKLPKQYPARVKETKRPLEAIQGAPTIKPKKFKPSHPLGIGRKTAKRSRGLPEKEDDHTKKIQIPNQNLDHITTPIEDISDHITAAPTTKRPMATRSQGTKGEPPPGSARSASTDDRDRPRPDNAPRGARSEVLTHTDDRVRPWPDNVPRNARSEVWRARGTRSLELGIGLLAGLLSKKH